MSGVGQLKFETCKCLTNGLGDVGRREGCSGGLIKQRLKEIMVASVNERDIDIRSGTEFDCARETAEPPPMMTTRRSGIPHRW
jgi:hypothetical protein